MDLRDLHYFRILADELNLGRASERIPISQPGLSAAVKRLEEECGTLLFDRLPRGVRLTRAGEVLRLHADRVVSAHDSARRSLRAIAAGERAALRFGMTPSVPAALFGPALVELLDQREGMRIDVTDTGVDGVRPALLRGDLDLGLIGVGIRDAGHADLVELDVGDSPFVPVVRRDHPRLAALDTPAALLQERFVGGSGGMPEVFEQTTRRLGLGAPRLAATANDLSTTGELAAASDLVALLPLTALSVAPDAPLVPLLKLTALHMPHRLSLVMRKDTRVVDATSLHVILSIRLEALCTAVRAMHGADAPAPTTLPPETPVAALPSRAH